jgi:hypothetical protein
MMSMRQGGKTLLNSCPHCGHAEPIKPHGRVEISVYHHGRLIDEQTIENIILYQGNGAIITSLATITPSTIPAIINRMAIGDQGTIPSNPAVPKVPPKNLPQLIATNGLYHEVYRKDADSRIITVNNGTTFMVTGNLTSGSPVVTTTSTAGMATGMSVSGFGIPPGDIVASINSTTQFTIGPLASTANGPQTLTISGAANQAQFTAEFDAVDIALSAYTNPSAPVINEVGLVIINPAAPAGLTRTPVTAPTAPPSDEVVMSIRTFPSIPFTIANDVSVTIRYTVYME